MKRDVDYQWRLAEVMARHGMHTSAVLTPLLRERGIDLSPCQVTKITDAIKPVRARITDAQ